MGGNALAHHHWGRHWVVNWDDGHWTDDVRVKNGDTAPGATREIAWPGGDKIEFDVPADVQYTQGPGPAKLVLTGPKDELDHIELSNGQLKFNDDDDDFDFTVGLLPRKWPILATLASSSKAISLLTAVPRTDYLPEVGGRE